MKREWEVGALYAFGHGGTGVRGMGGRATEYRVHALDWSALGTVLDLELSRLSFAVACFCISSNCCNPGYGVHEAEFGPWATTETFPLFD